MKKRRLALTAFVALALAACATQDTPKPAAAPAPAPAAKPAPAPAAHAQVKLEPAKPAVKAEPKPAPQKPAVLNLSSTELFEFNKATLTQEARAKLDNDVIAKLRDMAVRYIIVNGHADRLGSAQYNQRLSEQRAEAVRAYLVSRGADGSKIQTVAYGKMVQEKSCPDQKDRKALIECLAPNRRVVLEIQGTPR